MKKNTYKALSLIMFILILLTGILCVNSSSGITKEDENIKHLNALIDIDIDKADKISLLRYSCCDNDEECIFEGESLGEIIMWINSLELKPYTEPNEPDIGDGGYIYVISINGERVFTYFYKYIKLHIGIYRGYYEVLDPIKPPFKILDITE